MIIQCLKLLLLGRIALAWQVWCAARTASGVTGSHAGLVTLQPNQKFPTSTPLVAIVVLGENQRTLESVQTQTWTDIEIVVVGRDIPYPNGSKGEALNAGIAATQAPYVVCVDEGDVLAPTYIQKAVMLQEMFATPTLVMPLAHGRVVRAFNVHEMLHNNYTVGVAMFRRIDWEQAGGFSTALADDLVMWDYAIRLVQVGVKSHVINEVLYAPAATPLADIARQRLVLGGTHPPMINYQYCATLMAAWRFDYRTDPFLNIAQREPTPQQRAVMFVLNAPITGGAERIVEQVATHMKTQGWRVIVVAVQPPAAGYVGRDDLFVDSADEYYNLSTTVPQTFWSDFIQHIIKTRDVETLFSATVLFIYGQLIKLRAAFPSLRIIDFPFVPEEGALQYSAIGQSFIDARVIESQTGANIIASTGVPRSRIAVIPNGVDLQKFTPSARSVDFRQQFKRNETEPLIIGFCARLSPEKNIEGLVNICRHFSSNPAVQFVVVGDGPMAPVVQHTAKQQPNVHYVGMVKNLHLFLPNFDVLLLPSISEGRPNVMLEALACGTPVLGSYAGGIPEVVQVEGTGWCYHAADSVAFIKRIEWMLANRSALESMRVNCRRYAEMNLDRSLMIDKYAALIAGDVN